MKFKKKDKNLRAIAGMTIVGIGAGLIFVQTAPLLTVASIIIGIGLGLVLTTLISRKK